MPNARSTHAVRLEFAAGSLVKSNSSGAAFCGDWLWVVGDVACGGELPLGLRGPVLRGWSALLEITIEARGDELRWAPLDTRGALIRKHFIQLDGHGVRDLHFSGDELYILASSTMALNGDIGLFKWPGARPLLAGNLEPVRFEASLSESVLLPHGRGTNRAEAICELPPALGAGQPSWLVLYDAPGADRKEGEHTVSGDLLRRDGQRSARAAAAPHG